MGVKFANNFETTISGSINSSVTTIAITSATGFPSLGAGDYAYCTLQKESPLTQEIVKVTAISGTSLTVVRAQEGTSASAFASGDAFELRITATGLTEIATSATLAAVLGAGSSTSGTDMVASTDDKLIFRDSQVFIHSSTDGQLDIVADQEIQLAATTVDLNAALDVSGTATAAAFAGPLTGNVTGNVSGSAATVTGAAQSNITSVGTLTALAVGGNIGVTGTVDGRDVATDGTKLDGIAASATNTAAPHYTSAIAVGAGGLTQQNFTTTLKNKLDGIEGSATADQTAAQILTSIKTVDGSGSGLDADLLDGQQASAFAVASTTTTANAALPKAGGAMTGAITTNSTFDTRDVATDGTKLDTIETSATADQTKSDIEGLGIDLPAANLTGTVVAARLDTATTTAESDDSTKIATTAYVTDKITTLIGGAPSTLNDLNELAAAINDDANYNTTLTTALGTKLPKSGGAMTGAITTNSTFDGRDVATDGTKLDGIAASATNTAAPHYTSAIAVGAGGLTQQNFTTTLKNKLDGIATSANYITNNNQLSNGAGYVTTNTTYSVGDGGLSQNNFTNADHSKLNGIAASANNYSLPSTVSVADVYVSSWLRNNQSGTGLYNQSTGQHWYSDHDDWWNVAGGSSANGIRFRDEHNGTVRGAIYANNSNQIGLLDSGEDWCLRHTDGGSTEFLSSNSVKATITNAGNLTLTGTVDGRNVSGDGTKLDTIATNANYITNNNQLSNGAGYVTTNTTYSVGNGGLTQINFTSALNSKLSGIATNANYITNNNQLTNGAGYITSGGAYNAWAIKTSGYTAVTKDQLICNSSSAFTITLPSGPSAGHTVIVKNVGSGLITIGRNSQNINSAAANSTMPEGNAAQLVYVDSTIGWAVL